MSRIFITNEGHWYTELNLVSFLYETELEAKIIQHADHVFKEFFVIPFKKSLTTKAGDSSTPDLVMIRRNYEEWWFVEVEKADHPLSHVEGQVRVFKDAEWNSQDLTKYIIEKGKQHDKSLDDSLVYKLLSQIKQNILVIVDEPRPEWVAPLKKLGAKICIFQIYINSYSQELYRIQGEYPYIFTEESHCKLVKGLPRLLEVFSPEILTCLNDEIIDIADTLGRLSRWRRQDSKGKVYLTPIGINPLHPEKIYVIEKDTENNYHIRLN